MGSAAERTWKTECMIRHDRPKLLVARVATRDAKTLPWINEARR